MKKFAIICILIAAIVGIYYFSTKSGTGTYTNSKLSPVTASSSADFKTTKSNHYKNERFDFSVDLPSGYSARELQMGEGEETIILENGKGDGIQIMITPFEDIKVLTADMVKRDIPDIKMDQVQTVDIGQSYKGIAFLSDSPEFGGSSRDVWFVYKSKLYQISTYARLDALLQSIFSTWQFQQ